MTVGLIAMRYLMSLEEATVKDVFLMLFSWGLVLGGMFAGRVPGQIWPILAGMGGSSLAFLSAIT